MLFSLQHIETPAQSAQDFGKIWDKQHISSLPPSQVRHRDLQNYLEKLRSLGLKVGEVGRSYANREIYQIEFGKGATRVFMWSQMHGDEPTATSALVDLLAFLQTNRDKKWVREIEEKLTIRAVPMLNPDGAELFQRRNLQWIDINRDARALQTPEGRLLKKLRDEWQPHIGFNLHNQNSLTAAGNTNRQAVVSLLAVSGDPQGKSDEKHLRSRRICAVMVEALNHFIKGGIGRYDDAYNPRAFGDNFSAWGTPAILIETGAMHGKDEMFLVKVNFVAYLAALRSIVTGSETKAEPGLYDTLPFNDVGNLYNVLIRKATIVNLPETGAPFVSDLGIAADRRRAGEETLLTVREMGDMSIGSYGLEEYNAENFYLVPRAGNARAGVAADFLFYKKSRQIDWKATDLETRFPPDAVYKNGKWLKGERVVPKIN
ncbi:MAG: peptidase M14 [Acidobacteriota bacterium]|nr:peptidase M14 [Acidobacteriota bacterium]